MVPLKPIFALVAVIVIAACGPETPPNVPNAPGGASASNGGGATASARASVSLPPVASVDLDDTEVARLVFEAAVDANPGLVPMELPPRVSRVRVAVLALHDQLLERRKATPSRTDLIAALRRLSKATGGSDADALGPLVSAWSDWSDDEAAIEAEMMRHLSVGAAALTLPEAPGALGLSDLANKADEAGSPPPMSTAAAGVLFLHYATLAIGEKGSEVSGAQSKASKAALDAFIALDWPGGFAMLADPVAGHLLYRDSASMRGSILWSAAADAYMASGDLVRAGEMYVDRSRAVWRSRPDPEAAQRAASFAETGRKRIAKSGDRGYALFRACYVHAAALQAVGRHADAVTAAEEALGVRSATGVELAEVGDLGRIRAVSLYHLRRDEDAVAACDEALTALGPDFAPEEAEQRVVIASLHETAGAAAMRIERFDAAIAHFEALVAFYEQDTGQPWAPVSALNDARLALAGAIGKSGDVDAARAAIGKLVAAGPQQPGQMAKIADIFISLGLIDDAADVVGQGETAVGPERAPIFGELRGRIEAARGDLPAARKAFESAITHVTAGDSTRKSPRAALILESWARVEEQAGDRASASRLFERAANHLVDIGMQTELERLFAEAKRLR